MRVDPEVERRIRGEVERFAEILDVDAPPISFEETSVLGYEVHSTFSDDTLSISPRSVCDLAFDQIRMSIAYTLVIRVWVSENFAWVERAVRRAKSVEDREKIGWRRRSEIDKLAYQLVGDLNLVIEYIQTTGFRRPGVGVERNAAMMERRIAALRSL